MDRRATLEIYKCEHGFDVMELCKQLAENSVTLYTVMTSQPVPTYLPDPAHAFMADFFTGISLKTGGQFIQIQNIKLISEVKNLKSLLHVYCSLYMYMYTKEQDPQMKMIFF